MSRPITYNKSLGTRTVAPARPVARIQHGAGDSPDARARQLSELQRNLQQVTDAATAATPAKHVEVTLSAVDPNTIICHRLGRRARWTCTDWKPTLNGAPQIFESVTHDDEANTLILMSAHSGTATFEVR